MRVRSEAELDVLVDEGADVVVFEVQGEQSFSTVEALVRGVQAGLGRTRWVVLDFRRSGRIDATAQTLLTGLARTLERHGVPLAVTDPDTLPAVAALCRAARSAVRRFPDVDAALEWCENELLAQAGVTGVPESLVPLCDQELLADLTPEQLAVVEGLLSTRLYFHGCIAFEEGDPPDAIYFIAAGQVTADVRVGWPRRRARLATVGAGRAFGEMAVLDGGPRSSRIVIDEPTLCHVLQADDFCELQESEPAIAALIYRALAMSLSGRLRYTTGLLRALQP